jgi:predicted RNA-binding protein
MNGMNKGELERVKTKIGGGKLRKLLDKCGCHPKEVAKLKAKINL